MRDTWLDPCFELIKVGLGVCEFRNGEEERGRAQDRCGEKPLIPLAPFPTCEFIG